MRWVVMGTGGVGGTFGGRLAQVGHGVWLVAPLEPQELAARGGAASFRP